ncbi:alpha/beta hydrolase [uncultured Actinomyces sp.]|uniref:alpha/beta hydrolase n=1 Tax=uncultured Actinomyces sp. TaxID=249061 RepID=UPI002600B10F|nr:alpha/beta hydrolase [uncultured Actinomyces sp.]
MRPTPLTARKAGAALAALMLSAALAACQPQISAAGAATPTSVPVPSDQTSTTAGGSHGGSTGGSTASSTDASQTSTPQGLESFYSQSIDWQDCSDGTSPFQCGTVTVPLDYNNPGGRTITIALKKLPASDSDAEHGSLFFNPGGPGVSGIRTLETQATVLPEELRAGYDVVGFDPRGIGQSTPITCWTDEDIHQVLTDAQNGKLSDLASIDTASSTYVSAQEKINLGAADAAACTQHSEVPELLDHVGTRNVARDLDVLRATSGDATLNYLGVSYGTHIGAVYADLFPGRVGRAVLDGAMDPSQRWVDGEAEVTAFKEGVLHQYVEHCQTQDGCPLTGSTDEAIAQLTAFVDGLDQDPLTAPGSSITVNTENATAIVQQYAVEKPDWDALTTMLAPAMNNHDGTLMVKATQNSSDLSPKTTVEEVVSSANNEVMFGAVICNDYPDTGGTASDWDAQAAAEKKTYPFFGGTSNAMEAYCRGWGHRAQTPPQETHAEGSDPILVVGLTNDSRTLYPWAQSLTDQLDNGHLLTVEGYGHVTFGSNACATAAMTDFLVNGTVPAEGTTCDAGPQQAAGGAEG